MLIAVLGFLILGYTAHWLATNIEYVEETIDLGWSAKAKRHPYLAAEQFLSSIGLKVTASPSLQSLPRLPAGGTIFISNSAQVLGHRQVETLLDWVKSGGHLIVAAQAHGERPDPVLSYFDVSLETTDCDCLQNHPNAQWQTSDAESAPVDTAPEDRFEEPPPDDFTVEEPKKLSEILRDKNREIKARNRKLAREKQAGADVATDKSVARRKYEDSITSEKLTQLLFNDVAKELTVYFPPHSGLTHPSFYGQESQFDPMYWSGSDYGFHFMQFNVGEGLLSVLSDASIWRSDNIDKFDHAHLLTVLTSLSREVVLLYGGAYPSLWQLLQGRAPELLIALSLWLASWLIYRARRFGPVRQLQVTTRRSMAEHIYTCAEFLWQQGEQQLLVEKVRADTLRRIQLHHPSFNNLDRNAQIQLLSEHTHLSTDAIKTALFAPIPQHEAYFTRAIALLQTLWKKL